MGRISKLSGFLMAGLTVIFLLLVGNTALSAKREKGLYAVFTINGSVKGRVVCRLFENDAPKSVENFVDLAQGKKDWINPKNSKIERKMPFYNGLLFHRVIPNFMIQGGCPLGNGMGGPGYNFEDEFALMDSGRVSVINTFPTPEQASKLVHVFDKPGILAMANTGRPATNGSQFFITVAPTPWLNGHHSIFGEVVEGMDVVMQISKLPGDQQNKPFDKVYMEKVRIERVK